MRLLLLFLCLFVFSHTTFGQKVDYTIPEGYEKDISKKDYRKIVDVSVSIISKRYQIDHVKDGAIQLEEGQEMGTFNLHNLIGKCAAVKDKEQWESLIEQHYNNIFISLDEQKKINPEDFETVKKYLSIRLYGQDFIKQQGSMAGFISKTDLEGSQSILMLDMPGAFIAVERSVFEQWQKSEQEVFSIAQSNVNEQQVEKVTETFTIEGHPIDISFLGNEDYAASFALDLARNSPELVGEWGSVVAIPNKGLVSVCKVSADKPLDFVKYIQHTKKAIEQFYAQHPQPVSDQFYWYYQGKFTLIRVVQDKKGNVTVHAPLGLSDLMTTKK